MAFERGMVEAGVKVGGAALDDPKQASTVQVNHALAWVRWRG